MADEQLKQLVAQGLSAMKAGGEVAAKATDEVENDATHPDLKAALQQGNQTAKQWTERLDRALGQMDAGGPGENPIMQAHVDVSRRIRSEATDANTRDLGIVASGQLALHYWIAAFGTIRTYAEKLGMDDVARDMQTCLDGAKQADEAHNQIASQLMQAA